MTLDTSIDRPPIQVTDGTIYLRASSLGLDPRALAAYILGFTADPTPEFLEMAAEEGHLHEDAVADKIAREKSLELRNRQDACDYTHIVGEHVFTITGHREGIWYAGDTPVFLWENKAKSKDQFKLWMSSLDNRGSQSKPTFSNHMGHAWQISHYMMCPPHLPVMYTVKDRNSGEINYSYLYEDEAPFTEDDIRARLQSIVDILKLGVSGIYDNSLCEKSANRWQCPFRDALSCMMGASPDLDGVEEVDDDELEADLLLYESLKADAARIDKEKKAVSKRIKERVGAGKVVTLGGWRATVSETSVLDHDKLNRFLSEHGVSKKDFQKPSKQLTTNKPKGF